MAKVIELYVCCLCGVTNETCKNWGPICKKAGERVCAECCHHCEHRVSWYGIWRCGYITAEERREQIRKRSQDRFASENAKISAAYMKRKKERAREYAIKAAKARKK